MPFLGGKTVFFSSRSKDKETKQNQTKQRKGQSVEKAISIFKRKVKDSGILMEYRDRQFYEKPSAIKREKKNKAILRNKYKVLKEKERDN